MKHNIAPQPDLESVVGLLISCNLITADLMEEHMQQFLGCRDARGLRGVIGLQPFGNIGLLRSLAVRPDARGEGLGSKLVTALQNHARQNNTARLYLLTEDAQEFFATQGFKEINRDDVPADIQSSSQFSQHCPDSATLMEKCLVK